MNAREMFEKLGYEYKHYKQRISYAKTVYRTTTLIVFDLKTKQAYCECGMGLRMFNSEESKAVQQRKKELGWLDEKTCTNLSEFDSIDEFECSNCGIVLSEYQQIEIDEDDGKRFFYDYRPKYCPNCGRKIVN